MADKKRQGGFFDVELEDAEFESAIEDWISDASNRSESAAITKRRKEAFIAHLSQLKAGQRVRVGGYCFLVGETDRDEYTVSPVRALGMREVTNVLDAAEGD